MTATPWGYEVDGTLAPLVSAAELRTIAPTLSSTDVQLTAALSGVSQAVRSWCGWHIGPSLRCTYTGRGDGTLLMLPSMGVTAVHSLEIGGEAVDPSDYSWDASGMVRLKSGVFPSEFRSVTCEYTAGFCTPDVRSAVSQIALNAITAAPGVREEHAGQVGITYNQTGAGISGGVSLLDRDLKLLAPYRLSRAW